MARLHGPDLSCSFPAGPLSSPTLWLSLARGTAQPGGQQNTCHTDCFAGISEVGDLHCPTPASRGDRWGGQGRWAGSQCKRGDLPTGSRCRVLTLLGSAGTPAPSGTPPPPTMLSSPCHSRLAALGHSSHTSSVACSLTLQCSSSYWTSHLLAPSLLPGSCPKATSLETPCFQPHHGPSPQTGAQHLVGPVFPSQGSQPS